MIKQINIINGLSPQEQRRLHRWYVWSLILISIELFCIGLFFMPHLYTLYNLKKELAVAKSKSFEYEETIKRHDQLKKEYTALEESMNMIKQYTSSLDMSCLLVSTIQEKIDSADLESIQYSQKQVDIVVVRQSYQLAMSFVDQLQETKIFSQVTIVSLEHDVDRNQWRCVIKCLV